MTGPLVLPLRNRHLLTALVGSGSEPEGSLETSDLKRQRSLWPHKGPFLWCREIDNSAGGGGLYSREVLPKRGFNNSAVVGRKRDSDDFAIFYVRRGLEHEKWRKIL